MIINEPKVNKFMILEGKKRMELLKQMDHEDHDQLLAKLNEMMKPSDEKEDYKKYMANIRKQQLKRRQEEAAMGQAGGIKPA